MTLKVLPYAYKITHKETGQFYIGSRTSKLAKHYSEDLGFKYFTSSNYVKELGFENFKIDWIEEFDDSETAYDWEQMLIYVNLKDPLCLNKVCHFGKMKWSTTGLKIVLTEEHKRKISASGIGRKMSKETKNKIAISNTGKKFTDERKSNISKSKIGKITKNTGKKLTEERKRKIGETNKKYMAITNDIINIRILKTDKMPDGFRRGIKVDKASGFVSRWITNGIDNIKIYPEDPKRNFIPDGYYFGRTNKTKI